MNFYKKSAGVLQDVLQEVLQEQPKEYFRGLMEKRWQGSGNEGWIRLLKGMGLGKLSLEVMEIVGFAQGWRKQCCTKIQKLGQIEEVWQMKGRNMEVGDGAAGVRKEG